MVKEVLVCWAMVLLSKKRRFVKDEKSVLVNQLWLLRSTMEWGELDLRLGVAQTLVRHKM